MNNDILNLIYNYLIKNKNEINEQYKQNVTFDPHNHYINFEFNYFGNKYNYALNFRGLNFSTHALGCSRHGLLKRIHSFELSDYYHYTSGKNNECGFKND